MVQCTKIRRKMSDFMKYDFDLDDIEISLKVSLERMYNGR